MRVKINTDQIGLKEPISVLVNIPMADKATEMMEEISLFQIKALESDQVNTKDPESLAAAKANYEVTHGLRTVSGKALEFLKDVLKLDGKQFQTLKRVLPSQRALLSYAGYVCGRLTAPDVDQETLDPSPKAPSATSEEE